MRTAIEFYCGIGGAALAMREQSIAVKLAVDINPSALAIYRGNFPSHPTAVRELSSLVGVDLNADLWWLSPPCLPFTRRGRQRDLEDSRTESLIALIERIPQALPQGLVIENVPPFAESQTAVLTKSRLQSAGYNYAMEIRCPTEWGWPMRRRRCYLIASRSIRLQDIPIERKPKQLWTFLDGEPDPSLFVDAKFLDDYRSAIDIVNAEDAHGVTACFTSAYGRSPVRSGSYLLERDGRVRRFSPREILRLLGFPEDYLFEPSPSQRSSWSLVGNSLSVPVVSWALQRIFGRTGNTVFYICIFLGLVGLPGGCQPSKVPPVPAEPAMPTSESVSYENPIVDEELQALRNLVGVQTVHLQQGRLMDVGAEFLVMIPNLREVKLRLSPLSDAGFAKLARCVKLESINVPQAECTEVGIRELKKLPHLQSLRVGSSLLKGESAGLAFAELSTLRHLHLIDIPLGEEGLQPLLRLTHLQSLYLDGAEIPDEAWRRFRHGNPQLHLHLDQNHLDRRQLTP
jgi:site-specific DNA-cytosine methylase